MKQIALHHTADPSLGIQLYKVNRYHKNAVDDAGNFRFHYGKPSKLGWYVGYNVFCDTNGQRTTTRIIGEETAANRGHNCDVRERCDTISYCMAGDFRTQDPTPKQIADFTSFVNDTRKYYPNIVVIGHRDIGQTSCPGVSQAFIDRFNVKHTPDQVEKAETLPSLQSKLDFIRALILKIKQQYGLK